MLLKFLSAALLMSAFATQSVTPSTSPGDTCKPPCWKDPATGKIICGTPCP